ncbi:hypothetical protein J6590_035103 [Homalodisca vitripennis]|nr:hypothetical protein J6590_035103 [Homalodisca vitripennis]
MESDDHSRFTHKVSRVEGMAQIATDQREHTQLYNELLRLPWSLMIIVDSHTRRVGWKAWLRLRQTRGNICTSLAVEYRDDRSAGLRIIDELVILACAAGTTVGVPSGCPSTQLLPKIHNLTLNLHRRYYSVVEQELALGLCPPAPSVETSRRLSSVCPTATPPQDAADRSIMRSFRLYESRFRMPSCRNTAASFTPRPFVAEKRILLQYKMKTPICISQM